ncbi:hypothetical protein SprV_0702305000 [Sparganum proliferum]
MNRNASNCHCSWQRLDYWPKTNSYDLSLVVQVEKDSHVGSKSGDRFVLARRIRRRRSHRRTYTFEDMAEIGDSNWRRPIPRSAYLLYPQALDMEQVVADIRNCSNIPEAPIFNRTLRFLNVSSTVCVPGKAVERPLNAIVIVKSAIYNFADRDRIRRVYSKETQRETQFHIAMVFSVGLPRHSGGRFFHRDGFNISLPHRAGEAMEKMQTKRPEVLRNLTEEARVYGDLVLGDYEDTYYDLSLKLFHTFQWASLFCRQHFTSQQRLPVFIFLDDDFAFNASLLKAELDVLTDAEIRRVAWGLARDQSVVYRHLDSGRFSKWSLSKREMPWPYHAPFAPGNFYVMGADVLQEIALVMYFTLQFPIDDAWLGLVMTKLDLYFQSRPHMYQKVPKGVRKELVLFAPLDYLFPSKKLQVALA